MPVTVITGTKMSATVSFAPRTTADDATPGTAIPMACQYRTMNFQIVRPVLDPIVTLCQPITDFTDNDVGPGTASLNYAGYMTEGNLTSDPMYLAEQEYAGELVNVFGTGNTLTADGRMTSDSHTFEAKNPSARGTSFIVTGTPTSDWTNGVT